MVLCTRDRERARSWKARLPAALPTDLEQALSAKDRSYVPATAHPGVREKAQHDLEAAVRMLWRWLERNEYDEASLRGGKKARYMTPDRDGGEGPADGGGGACACARGSGEGAEAGCCGGGSVVAGGASHPIMISDPDDEEEEQDAIVIDSDEET